MLLISFLILLVVAVSGITTIPFYVGLLAVITVFYKKSWVFFLAFGLGLYLDLIFIRPLSYTSLILTIFVLLIRLYERKFEIKTTIFVFISSFLGSLIYLKIFDYQQVLLQSLVTSLFAIIFFKMLWLKLDRHSEII